MALFLEHLIIVNGTKDLVSDLSGRDALPRDPASRVKFVGTRSNAIASEILYILCYFPGTGRALWARYNHPRNKTMIAIVPKGVRPGGDWQGGPRVLDL
jgi:hypothetical protein